MAVHQGRLLQSTPALFRQICAAAPRGGLLISSTYLLLDYKNDQTESYLGFIAEDVPELVATRDRDGLSSMDIVAVLTKVVQEQQKKIEELEARLDQR